MGGTRHQNLGRSGMSGAARIALWCVAVLGWRHVVMWWVSGRWDRAWQTGIKL
jgi:hypothetical protein